MTEKNYKFGFSDKHLSLFTDLVTYIRQENAELIILGDFLELWKSSFIKILMGRSNLFDKLCELKVCYVPGNHDDQVISICQNQQKIHPFFENVSKPFIRTFGDKKIKFMHGHEVDPFIPDILINMGKVVGLFSYVSDFSNCCLVSNDKISDVFFNAGEWLLKNGKLMAAKMGLAFDEVSNMLHCHGLDDIRRSLRTQRMLLRYYVDCQSGVYDSMVVGHSHREGSFGDWYFNSGSWTGKTNNVLEIDEYGNISIFDWTENGLEKNKSIIK